MDFFTLILIFQNIVFTLIVECFGTPLNFEVSALLPSPSPCLYESGRLDQAWGGWRRCPRGRGVDLQPDAWLSRDRGEHSRERGHIHSVVDGRGLGVLNVRWKQRQSGGLGEPSDFQGSYLPAKCPVPSARGFL